MQTEEQIQEDPAARFDAAVERLMERTGKATIPEGLRARAVQVIATAMEQKACIGIMLPGPPQPEEMCILICAQTGQLDKARTTVTLITLLPEPSFNTKRMILSGHWMVRHCMHYPEDLNTFDLHFSRGEETGVQLSIGVAIEDG